MNIPPLDPAGAKGEHFHSLVDNAARPRVFVIQDNTRAFPGTLNPKGVSYHTTSLVRSSCDLHLLAACRASRER